MTSTLFAAAWRRRISTALAAAALFGLAQAADAPLRTATVQQTGAGQMLAFDGVVEAVRQTVIAAQVQGAVVELAVKAGDAVKTGQVLLRLDARAAQQSAAASQAQVLAARAAQDVATREFQRQKALFAQQYISQAALDQAEAQYRATQAQLSAQIAQADVSRTQSGFFVVRAPYAGVVSDVPVSLGDMALPGRPLLTLYDPGALRVSAAVPQSVASQIAPGASSKLEFPNLPGGQQWVQPTSLTFLPVADAATHTQQAWLTLPAAVRGITPGLFARAWLPAATSGAARLSVPARAVVQRGELTALYVIDREGRPQLRQVRLGSSAGDTVEVLSGVSAGERVALDPLAAAQAH
ncbi:MAG: efflux RND transporter periplasmic adaptor subunit [Betaproteobacteria bacterium]|nr:efflux RND transporter periplasmic adaptor subunit [Betaproteobacteria bacterium]